MSEAEIWTNQKMINGRLCQVDWRLIEALKEVVAALKSPGAGNIDHIEHWINEADEISASVAIPDPPGCLPRDRNAGLGGG